MHNEGQLKELSNIIHDALQRSPGDSVGASILALEGFRAFFEKYGPAAAESASSQLAYWESQLRGL